VALAAAVVVLVAAAPASAVANPWPNDPRVSMTDSRQAPEIDLTGDLAWWAARGITTAPAPDRHGFPGCPSGITAWTAENLLLHGQPVQGVGAWCDVVLDTTDIAGPLPPAEMCHLRRHEVGHALGLEHSDAPAHPIMATDWQLPADCVPHITPDAAPRKAKKRKRARHRRRAHMAFRTGTLRRVKRSHASSEDRDRD
jgi:hypothetical protein